MAAMTREELEEGTKYNIAQSDYEASQDIGEQPSRIKRGLSALAANFITYKFQESVMEAQNIRARALKELEADLEIKKTRGTTRSVIRDKHGRYLSQAAADALTMDQLAKKGDYFTETEYEQKETVSNYKAYGKDLTRQLVQGELVKYFLGEMKTSATIKGQAGTPGKTFDATGEAANIRKAMMGYEISEADFAKEATQEQKVSAYKRFNQLKTSWDSKEGASTQRGDTAGLVGQFSPEEAMDKIAAIMNATSFEEMRDNLKAQLPEKDAKVILDTVTKVTTAPPETRDALVASHGKEVVDAVNSVPKDSFIKINGVPMGEALTKMLSSTVTQPYKQNIVEGAPDEGGALAKKMPETTMADNDMPEAEAQDAQHPDSFSTSPFINFLVGAAKTYMRNRD